MKKANLKKRLSLLMILTLVFIVSGCGKTPNTNSSSKNETGSQQNSSTSNNTSNSSNNAASNSSNNTASNTAYKSQYSGKKPIVTIEMSDGSKITAELYPDIAPKTVDNFISLIQKNFYDGLIFHRVIPDFMIQGGDPQGIGVGGPGYSIPGEFKSNGFKNDLKHTRGVLSMARSQNPNSAGSQFFIMVKDTPQLDGDYAAFGKVTNGMETVDKIVSTKTDPNDKPITPQVMKKVTVSIQ
jgi:peptidyl-prolyl cis-trans isomerase B (cyclophilin B)